MAIPVKNKFDLNPNRPGSFKAKYFSLLQMRYSVVGETYYFDYRSDRISAEGRGIVDALSAIREKLSEAEWILFYQDDRKVQKLDINVYGGDTLVTVEMDDNGGRFPNIYWSHMDHSVKTAIDRKGLYGELRYSVANAWVPNVPVKMQCKALCFDAVLNDDLTDTSHEFSYNVYLADAGGNMKTMEIDPDIQNPSR